MNDHDALLAAVLADPDDDLRRLVFADFLEETGHPANVARADFVRAQVGAAALPPESDDRATLEHHAAELFRLYGDGWTGALPDWVMWHDTSVVYTRGFVGELVTTPRRFMRDAHELFAIAPVTTVRLRAKTYYFPPHLANWFVDHPFLSRVVTLQLGPRLFAPDRAPARDERSVPVFLLSESRNLGGLRQLILSNNDLDDDWVVNLIARFPSAAFADRLEVLDLSSNRITDAGASTLAAARGLDRLTELVLTGNRIGLSGALLLRRRFGDRVRV